MSKNSIESMISLGALDMYFGSQYSMYEVVSTITYKINYKDILCNMENIANIL